ncbi:MAG: hypothetical protein AAF687_00515 [Pseudomonadota bacterium]
MRLLTILFAYLCASLIAPMLLILHGVVTEGISANFEVSEFFVIFGLFGAFAAAYALPVALPVIVTTELLKRGSWQIFAITGVGFGLVMTALFTEIPLSLANYGAALPILPIVFACVMTYWAVAWRWLAPDRIPE